MKKLFLALTLVFLLIPNTSQAVLINFDNLSLGSIDGVDLGGVTFTGSPYEAKVFLGDSTGQGYISPKNSLSTVTYITFSDLTMTFDPGIDYVSFYGGDAGGDQDRFFVDVFDTSSNLIKTIDTGIFGGNALDPSNFMIDNYQVIISGLGEISSVVVRDAINFGILLDNVEFTSTSVPDASVMLLLGSSLLGLGVFSRKSKNS
jgi:hypothetical protein